MSLPFRNVWIYRSTSSNSELNKTQKPKIQLLYTRNVLHFSINLGPKGVIFERILYCEIIISYTSHICRNIRRNVKKFRDSISKLDIYFQCDHKFSSQTVLSVWCHRGSQKKMIKMLSRLISHNRECFPKIFHLVAQIWNISKLLLVNKSHSNFCKM